MDAATMKYEFQARNELLPGLDSPDLEDEEINMFLNSAQIKIVEDLYAKGMTELLTELYVLENSSVSSNYLEGINNAKCWTLENLTSYMFLINSSVTVNKFPTGIEMVKCVLIDKKDAFDFAETSKNKVWFEYPKIFIDNDKLVVIVNTFITFPSEVQQLRATFIKKPILIDVTKTDGSGDCKLKDILHTDIVEIAVKLATSTYKLEKNTEDSEK